MNNNINRKGKDINSLTAEVTIRLLKKLSIMKQLTPDFVDLSKRLSAHLARLFEGTCRPAKDDKTREEIGKARRQIEDYLEFVAREDSRGNQTLVEIK